MPELPFGQNVTAYKNFFKGTHRVVSPEQTLSWIQPFMQVMGITRIANVTGLDNLGIPVVMVCRPNSRSLSVSQGKGMTLSSAKASGLMESVESYHAEHITLSLKLGSYEELQYTHRIVDVDNLPSIVISRFHPNLRLLWVEGADLLNEESVWVPYEMVHTDYTLPLPAGSGCFQATSNGLASGNHLLEAISHGICEVIERDSTAMWLTLGTETQNKTMVDLNTVDDADCCELLGKCERSNIKVSVWETTTDIGIPSFLCSIIESLDDGIYSLYSTSGMGCHPSRNIALLRALTEAAQSRLTLIVGSRDDAFRSKYEYSRDHRILQSHRRQMEATGPMRNYRDIPTSHSNSLDEDVKYILNRLTSIGIQRVIVVNLTKAEFRIPVVRVIVPGLEGVSESPGYTPGRRAKMVLKNRV